MIEDLRGATTPHPPYQDNSSVQLAGHTLSIYNRGDRSYCPANDATNVRDIVLPTDDINIFDRGYMFNDSNPPIF